MNGSIDAFAIYNSVTEKMAIVPVDDLPKDQSYFFLLCRDSKRGSEKGHSRLFESYVV
jgi:hypothetical protein